MIQGFHRDALWSRVRWRWEMRLGPFGRKQPDAAPGAKLRCVVAFNAQSAKREGDLPKNADPTELARYVMTVLQGMAVQGADGASPINYVESRKSHCARSGACDPREIAF